MSIRVPEEYFHLVSTLNQLRMMLSKTLLIIALSASTALSAKWTQLITSIDDKCSNIDKITQNLITADPTSICRNLDGTCMDSGPTSLASSCVDDAPKSIPEAVKSGQWAQTRTFLRAECSGDPYSIIYQKSNVCQRTGPSSWVKSACDGGSAIDYACTDDKCTNCAENVKLRTTFCNTTTDGASPFKAQYISCFKNGQQQSGPTNSAAKIAVIGIIPLVSAVIVALF
jgi:hypothetical protein